MLALHVITPVTKLLRYKNRLITVGAEDDRKHQKPLETAIAQF